MAVAKREWVSGLDSIRFVLAFIVFLSHLENPFHDFLGQSSHLIVRAAGMLSGVLFSGIGAVMAFFIISGFVIHYPNKDRFPDTWSFLIRRWLRIGLPLVIISLIAWRVHEFSAIPIWSLYCELVYYTLYPLLIRIRLSWTRKFWIAFILSLVLIISFAHGDRVSFLHQRDLGYNGAYWQLGDLFTWIVGLPCWLLGVILAEKVDGYKMKITTGNIYLWRFGVLTVGILLDVLKFHFFLSYFFSMNIFAIVLFFWIGKEIVYFREKRPFAFMENLGKFSYSLYLCHNVIVFFILQFLPLNIYTYFPVILLTLLGAYAFYSTVEYPSHLLSRRAAKLARSNGKIALGKQ